MLPIAIKRTRKQRRRQNILRITVYSLLGLVCCSLTVVSIQSFLNFKSPTAAPPSTDISDDQMMRNFNEERLRFNPDGEFLDSITNAENQDKTVVSATAE